ncbi:cytochrome b561 [Sulfitobacter guttiformis]|uniref:Cytochrome b561 n=1 Tax=Sulfitobacter guttiformis TaxID=74349 RepID=A0A420DK12_9RHOB|nr:cytochrome b561 [Sulfitobacter guttiformis]KIN71582.1 Cytochrome B561 [Sulfitobacter guttiformis KCTC 32187]RKE94583.1 cytochrome b561 [Sulfitobacter guttiformis]
MKYLTRYKPHRRKVLKWMHGLMIPLFVWFLLVTPDVVVPMGKGWFALHSNLALVFVSICLWWTADVMRRGLASRPGPKLPQWARLVHRPLHLVIIWGLFLVALGGFLLGLTSIVQLKAGLWLPIAPPMGWRRANEVIGTLHIYQFYLLGIVIAAHAAFHIWRHFKLRDNALRIMAPKVLQRFL